MAVSAGRWGGDGGNGGVAPPRWSSAPLEEGEDTASTLSPPPRLGRRWSPVPAMPPLVLAPEEALPNLKGFWPRIAAGYGMNSCDDFVLQDPVQDGVAAAPSGTGKSKVRRALRSQVPWSAEG